jgi:hypothetical protein
MIFLNVGVRRIEARAQRLGNYSWIGSRTAAGLRKRAYIGAWGLAGPSGAIQANVRIAPWAEPSVFANPPPLIKADWQELGQIQGSPAFFGLAGIKLVPRKHVAVAR